MQFSKDLSIISRYLRRKRNAYLEPLGLKSLHGRYLLEVCHCPGISQDGLTQLLGFDKSGVARHAAFLEEQGYLCRQPGRDKRVQMLYPTEKTLALYPQLLQAMEDWEHTLLQDLTTDEKQLLQQLLSRVRSRAEQEGSYGQVK